MITVRDMIKNDEIWTPYDAVYPLFPYISHDERYIIWEPCPGSGKLIEILQMAGWFASSFGIKDGLKNKPPDYIYNAIITNPPWSKKHLFLQRCVEIGKPFALLLPVRTLGVRRCQIWMNNCDFLFLPKRVDYTGGNSPYEASFWVTSQLLPERVIFAPDESMNG